MKEMTKETQKKLIKLSALWKRVKEEISLIDIGLREKFTQEETDMILEDILENGAESGIKLANAFAKNKIKKFGDLNQTIKEGL